MEDIHNARKWLYIFTMYFIRKKIWLPIIINRIFVFLLFFIIMNFCFFLIGNFQSFLDSTQLLLLRLVRTAGIFFIIFGGFTIPGQIFSWFYDKKFKPLLFIITCIGYGIGAGLTVLVYFFLSWLTPLAV